MQLELGQQPFDLTFLFRERMVGPDSEQRGGGGFWGRASQQRATDLELEQRAAERLLFGRERRLPGCAGAHAVPQARLGVARECLYT